MISGNTKNNGEAKNKSLYFIVIFLGFLAHVLYEVIFIAIDAPKVLIYYNIVSILVFGGSSYFIRKNENPYFIFACFIEVTIFISIAIYNMGWGFEFQNWLFSNMILSLMVTFKNRKIFKIASLMNIFMYIVLFYITYDKVYPVNYNIWYGFLFFINIFCAFFFIIFAERHLRWAYIVEKYTLSEKYMNMEKRAITDELTGLYNRYKIKELLDDLNEKMGKKEEEFYISFADIDDFKVINDTYGHDIGDKVLKYISNEIKRGIGGKNTVARWGGEEFLIIINSPVKRDEVYRMLDQIRNNIAETTFVYQNIEIDFTITFGVSSSKFHKNIYDMTKRADELLYIGKNRGKNIVFME